MPTVPEGGLVLVTGANGYLASHAVKVLIDRGYKVRGTVRSIEKNSWMLDHFGTSNIELVEVKDFGAPHAFDDAAKGVDGIAHIASIVNFSKDTDAENYIDPVVRGAINILEAAAKEPKVKSVVYCSSTAALMNVYDFAGKPYTVGPNNWNEAAVKLAYNLPEEQAAAKLMYFYMASKTLAEQKSFEWVKTQNPHFTFNSVLPNCNFGGIVNPEKQGYVSSAGLLYLLWNGNPIGASLLPPEWFVDPEDVGLLHLAALTQPDVQNERVFGLAQQFTWNQILSIYKKLAPEREFLESIEEAPEDQGTVETWDRSNDLIKRMGKKGGFSTLEESIGKMVDVIKSMEGKTLPETEAQRM